MSAPCFQSPLADRLKAFFEMRIALKREIKSEKKLFLYLDRFLAKALKPGRPITREIVESWLKSMEALSTGTRINRTSTMRQFCRYLSQFDPRTYLIHENILPRRIRRAPYIYSHAQVQKIMRVARERRSPVLLQPGLHATLIGLLYATGIRIGEALKLTLQDVDFQERVLVIRQTKFGKTRYVPISDSTVNALQSFLNRRKQAGHSVAPTAPVFVSKTGHNYCASRLHECFLPILRKLGMRGPKGTRGPRIHDFRHTFAVQRLLAWYRSGVSLQAKLPLLTTYLGHTTVTGTEVYLQATAELLDEANKKFHKNYAIPIRMETEHVQS